MDKVKAKKIFPSAIDASDTTAPSVTDFAATTPNIGGTIAITTFTASEVGVLFLITTSSTPPLAGAAGWNASAPTTFDATSEGSCTLYPWVKDPSGNVSAVYGSPVAVSVYETPAYTNAGGTGDRRANITITNTKTISTTGGGTAANLLDGITNTSTIYFSAEAVSGKYVRFDFASGKIIKEAKFYQGDTSSHGTWKWQGSNNATDWIDIGTTFTLGGVTTQTQTQLSGNATPYRYYQLIGVSGNSSSSPFVFEFEFKIGNLVP